MKDIFDTKYIKEMKDSTAFITNDIGKVRKKLNEDIAERNIIEKNLKNKRVQFEEIKKDGEALLNVRVLFQEAATMTQRSVEEYISNIVSTALASVWDDPYIFQLEFVSKRGKTEAEMWFIKDGAKLEPMESSGGGALDIASMALRVAAWGLNKTTRPIMILDEPFRNLSKNLQPAGNDILHMLKEELNLQFILVSHIMELVENVDHTILVEKIDGESRVQSGV